MSSWRETVGRIEELADHVYGAKVEDLEEHQLREIHEMAALLAGDRMAPRRHPRLDSSSRAGVVGGVGRE